MSKLKEGARVRAFFDFGSLDETHEVELRSRMLGNSEWPEIEGVEGPWQRWLCNYGDDVAAFWVRESDVV